RCAAFSGRPRDAARCRAQSGRRGGAGVLPGGTNRREAGPRLLGDARQGCRRRASGAVARRGRARRDARIESTRRPRARDRAGAAGRDRVVAAGRTRGGVAFIAADRRGRIDFSPGRRDAGLVKNPSAAVILFRKVPRFLPPLLCGFALLVGAVPARAQALPGYQNTFSWSREKIGENHMRLVGCVELEQTDTKIFADEVELFLDENRAIATGNVLFTQGANRIAADRADFNTATRLGTFYNARGIANVQPPRQRPRAGGVAPPPTVGQDNDVYFFGETIEKIGPKKYKIINGGFSTCVQRTPRWSLTAGTVVLNIDHYTVLKEPTLMVKGVPLLYLPFPLYYPTKKEDRATGFLIPTYGITSLRGQQLHNAFFWAINRSQDATIEHEFYSKVGQGLGGEYRYNHGGIDAGNLQAHFLDQHAATYDQGDGTTQTVDGSRTFV